MAESKTPNYNTLLQTLITNFNKTAKSWSTDIDAYLKGTHDKGITIQDWNTMVGLVQQARYFVMAAAQVLPKLSDLGKSLETDLTLSDIDVSDDGILTITLGSGVSYSAAGMLEGPQGPQGEQGPPGNDYALTSADKDELKAYVKTSILEGKW